eukprot:CAMPEP_0203936626 /NCGR_PEP_ID=MMETSP0359-20131031/74101_1 /ASSEMBLY_ACC=CAM_ASM_000338 /TAXON_ID=268821 /ORGANISM="Scrippsiella Hangoei, Strain SHTV-5" /LENGTH=256 /DNA_ID=CAMNT_0050866619 /DNA_START=14 /DNA_END=781 /DNA_ORIENTATION=+
MQTTRVSSKFGSFGAHRRAVPDDSTLEVQSVTDSDDPPQTAIGRAAGADASLAVLPRVPPSPALAGRTSVGGCVRPRSAEDSCCKAPRSWLGGPDGGASSSGSGGWVRSLEPPPRQLGRSSSSRPPISDGLLALRARPATSDGVSVEVRSLPDLRWERVPLRTPSQEVAQELRMSAARLLQGDPFRGTAQETFLCLVCFENQTLDQRVCLAECQAQGHGCCLQCASSFFKSRILQGRVFELPCPVGAAEGGCRAAP